MMIMMTTILHIAARLGVKKLKNGPTYRVLKCTLTCFVQTPEF